MPTAYVHGYDKKENTRLQDQAATLAELLHHDSVFPDGSRILEAGCGVGAQTITLAAKNPASHITSIDISPLSLAEAQKTIDAAGITNVTFLQGDIYNLTFEPESFDCIFVCFVLEHLANPVQALITLQKFLKPGGSIIAIEGDHGSAFFHPNSEAAHRAIECQVQLQARAKGNALIGRELYPLLCCAGLTSVHVSPRMVYVDSSRPELVDGFTKKTFTAMIEGVRAQTLEAGLIDGVAFDKGIHDLYRTAEPGGVFCYTFFKAFGTKAR